MEAAIIVFLFIISYLLGSIPTSIWIGKAFFGIDVREHGSGNAGATNTIRVLGWKAGLPVFIIDVLKGVAAVELAYLSRLDTNSIWFINLQLGLGLMALVGHIFPFFAGFKGGKGVAALLGIVLSITTGPALIAFGIFIVILFLFKYVSVGSIIAGISYPLIVTFIFPHPLPIEIASIVMASALVITHRKNIKRLLKGEESKFLKPRQKKVE